MQQLHRPDIYCTLTNEMKSLSENYHTLRIAIIELVKNIDNSSQYFTPIDEGRTQNALMQIEDPSLPTWEDQLTIMSSDGKWFDDQFVRFSAFFLKRDIIIHTSTQDMKYCGSPNQEDGDVRVEHQCDCNGPNIHIANIGNYHFQSIVPIKSDDGKSISNSSIQKYTCSICNKVFSQPQYLSRHVKVDHENVHNTQSSVSKSSLGFSCSMCTKFYRNKRDLTRHIKGSHSNISYSCNECNQVYSRSDMLSRHMKDVHSSTKDYRCEQCNQCFFSKIKLNRACQGYS